MRPFYVSPKIKRDISKIFPFGIICFSFGILWSLIERSLLGNLEYYPVTGLPYQFSSSLIINGIGSFFFGMIIGAFEVLFLNKLFIKRSFGVKILIKSIFYIIALSLLLISLTIVFNSITSNVSLFDPEVFSTVKPFISTLSFWIIIIYMGVVIIIMLFFSEVSDNLGQGVLKNFLFGKYHKAREEERIFMFLDMKSSTTIAEKIGHVNYYRLLNEYYADLTEAIIQTSGAIYQYVGDEVVVSWKLKDGLQNNNCLNCFFAIKEILERDSKKYIREFGLVPGFKAGFHYGKVTTGEIGIVKKEIIFTGDVLNTTARIQSVCNTYDVEILISNELLSHLKTEGKYNSIEIGECELRGRDAKVKLFTIAEK
jgi:adenylate cyclase